MKRYFKPKAFEIYPKRTLYEFIGINIYKKYLPMTGDLARKWRKIVQIKPHKAERINELYRYKRETRKNELRHLIGTAICIGLVFVVDKKNHIQRCAHFNLDKSLRKYLSDFPSEAQQDPDHSSPAQQWIQKSL